VEELHALCDAVEAGVPLEKAAKVRTTAIYVRPPVLSPSQIRAIRSSLNLSETLFATFLGVRIATLRSWEQGRSAPSSLARRFLVAIRDDPGYWKGKLERLTIG
jgi:putative transcriptional regulator